MSQSTPSPSDSAVGDLESMLKEKDTEIIYLRETMEQNEQVIFKVRMLTGPAIKIWEQIAVSSLARIHCKCIFGGYLMCVAGAHLS